MQTFKSQNIAFTLVEIMVVVAVIGLLAAIAAQSSLRARMRAQATLVLDEARQLDGAKDSYAVENNKDGAFSPTFTDLTPYLKAGSKLASNSGNDSMGNAFTIGVVSARLQVSAITKDALSVTTGGDSYWGPYS
jgi:prepilin-type N-terminal cleavage/methylation domain-containing protein